MRKQRMINKQLPRQDVVEEGVPSHKVQPETEEVCLPPGVRHKLLLVLKREVHQLTSLMS